MQYLTDKIIRLYIDDELTPEKAEAVDRHLADHPEEALRIEAERVLKSRVKAILTSDAGVSMPTDLADRVQSALQATPASSATHTAGRIHPATHTQPRPTKKTRWWAEPYKVNLFAAAATIALVTGVILFGIYSPSIDSIGRNTFDPTLQLTEAASFATTRHGVCKHDWNIPVTAEQSLTEVVGHRVRVFDLKDLGYEFQYAGHCKLPYCGDETAHIVYHRTDPQRGPALLSIFCAPDSGQFGDYSTDETWRRADGPGCPQQVLKISDGSVVYLLLCCDEQDMEMLADRLREMIRSRR